MQEREIKWEKMGKRKRERMGESESCEGKNGDRMNNSERMRGEEFTWGRDRRMCINVRNLGPLGVDIHSSWLLSWFERFHIFESLDLYTTSLERILLILDNISFLKFMYHYSFQNWAPPSSS